MKKFIFVVLAVAGLALASCKNTTPAEVVDENAVVTDTTAVAVDSVAVATDTTAVVAE